MSLKTRFVDWLLGGRYQRAVTTDTGWESWPAKQKYKVRCPRCNATYATHDPEGCYLMFSWHGKEIYRCCFFCLVRLLRENLGGTQRWVPTKIDG